MVSLCDVGLCLNLNCYLHPTKSVIFVNHLLCWIKPLESTLHNFFCNKTGGLAINLYRKLNTYAKDLNFSRICSRLVDFWDDMIPYCLKSSWKWFFRQLLQTFFIVFLYHFLPVLYTVVNYPNTWFTRSFLAQSAHKSNKIYNKIQNIWFPLPTYSVLKLPKQCLR